MWRWEDVLQTPTIGRTLRSDALGNKQMYRKCTSHYTIVFPPYLGLQLTLSFWFERCPPHVKINIENPRRYLTGRKPHIHKPQLVLLSNGISILFGVARHESARAPMYVRFPWVHGSYVTFEYASFIGQCISHAFPSCLFHAHFLVARQVSKKNN